MYVHVKCGGDPNNHRYESTSSDPGLPPMYYKADHHYLAYCVYHAEPEIRIGNCRNSFIDLSLASPLKCVVNLS